MKEKPILFSAPMVRAILDGRKTQTRRVLKSKDGIIMRLINTMQSEMQEHLELLGWRPLIPGHLVIPCKFGQPKDTLWVRETWQGFRQTCIESDEWEPMDSPKDRHNEKFDPVYRADGKSQPDKWFPAIHMPRWASRITLEIINVRVERLKDISEADARAEGAREVDWEYDNGECPESCKEAFECLWNHINGPDSWAANPWVWVIEFKLVKT